MYIRSGWMPARALERDSIKSSLLFSYIVGSLFLKESFFPDYFAHMRKYQNR